MHAVTANRAGPGWVAGRCGSWPGPAAGHYGMTPMMGPMAIIALMHRTIKKVAAHTAEADTDGSHVLFRERRRQRAQALGSILRSATSVLVFGLAGIQIASDLGLNLAPVLASAGVLGLAIGFGAQSLVKDYLSGIFMLVEDQYGVGDVINSGYATGTVEAVSLRVTRLRDVNGV